MSLWYLEVCCMKACGEFSVCDNIWSIVGSLNAPWELAFGCRLRFARFILEVCRRSSCSWGRPIGVSLSSRVKAGGWQSPSAAGETGQRSDSELLRLQNTTHLASVFRCISVITTQRKPSPAWVPTGYMVKGYTCWQAYRNDLLL